MAEESKSVDVQKEGSGEETPVPVDSFSAMRQEMNRVFDNFLTGFPRFPFGADPFQMPGLSTQIGGTEFRAPAVDVKENDGAFVITAELPGMKEDDVHVSVSGGTLTIKGEKKDEHDEEKDNRHLTERRYGSFQRSFRLPPNVDAEKIGGDFSNGVLKLTLPKAASAENETRKVEIKSS